MKRPTRPAVHAALVGLVIAPGLAVGSAALAPVGPATAAPDTSQVTSATLVTEPSNGVSAFDTSASFRGPDQVWVDTGVLEPTRQLRVELTPPESAPPALDYRLEFGLGEGQGFTENTTYVAPKTDGYDVDVPLSMEMTGGSTSCGASGQLTVRELAPDLSRVWVTFIARCRGEDPAVHGEIRINVDAPTVAGVLAPGVVEWPLADVGESAPPSDLQVQNHGAVPASLGTPRVTGRQAADFAVRHHCDEVAAGASCPVTVVFTPRAPGRRRAALHVPVGLDGDELTVELLGAGIGGYTSWRTWTDPGDDRAPYTRRFGPSDWFFGEVDRDSVYVSARGPGYIAWFAPPAGQRLRPGRYENAARWPFNDDRPGMSLHSGFDSCRDLAAAFDVHEVSYDVAGNLASLAVTYRQACPSASYETRGSLSWRASRQPPAPRRPLLRVTSDRRKYRPGDTARITTTLLPGGTLGVIEVRLKVPGRPARVIARSEQRRTSTYRTHVVVRKRSRVTVVLLDNPWPVQASRQLRIRHRR